MDRHPIILEQRVKSIALDHREIIRVGKNGCIQGVPQQEERTAAHFNIISKIDSRYHGDEEQLHHAKPCHHAWFPSLCRKDYNSAKDYMPKHPQQKTPFLAFPECGENIFHRQVIGDVVPDIPVIVELADHHVKNETDNRQYGKRMGEPCSAT